MNTKTSKATFSSYQNVFLSLLLLGIWGCKTQSEDMLPDYAITNVSTIDAQSGQQDDMTVLIKGNQILKVIPSDEYPLPDEVTWINGTGKYLIPGLWDAHVHFVYDQLIGPAMFDLFLVNGITSVRDTGGKMDEVKPYKEASKKNPDTTPRVMIAGPLIDGMPRVYDGSSPGRPELSVGVDSPEEARQMVIRLKNEGVDLLKAYEMLRPEVYQALLDEAQKQGLPVTGHVPLSIDVISASEAGLNSIEHMRNLEMSCTEDWAQLMEQRRQQLAEGRNEAGGDLRSRLHQRYRFYSIENQDSEMRSEVLEALAENDTWLVPTLTILAARENRVWDRPSWREYFKYLPDTVAQRWTETALQISELPLDSNAVKYANWGYDVVSRLPDANVKIMAGTDTPIALLTPGPSLHEELRLLVKSGLTPLEALEAATLRPAQYFGMEDSLGTIAKGQIADLVLLNKNPMDDISNTQTIQMVIKNGNLMDRRVLDGMMRKLEEQ
jgi:imidazolonepropionase-like amidohydrolase